MNDEIKATLSEAQVYESMGLFAEALAVYENALPRLDQGDAKAITDVSERILKLKKKLADDASRKNEASEISKEALEHIKERKADEKDITPIIDRAAVFTEKGLHAEAANEYAMLFGLGFSPETVISPIVDTLVAICPHGQIGKEIGRIVDRLDCPAAERVTIVRGFSMGAAERGKFTSAADIFEKLKDLRVEKKEIEAVWQAIVKQLISAPRFAALIQDTILTEQHLETALKIAHQEKRSILSALVSRNMIEKGKLLGALSAYHGCAAVVFDDYSEPPAKLVMELSRSLLLARRWVPLKWDDSGAEVLMENPGDIYQKGQVKSFLSTGTVEFKIGIQEDIEKYIEYFFETGEKLRRERIQKESSEAGNNMVMDIVEMLEHKDGQQQERDVSIRPQLISAELILLNKSGKEDRLLVRLKDSPEFGFGFLVSSEEYARLGKKKSGDTIDDIIFYAGWAMIRTQATVKKMTRIKSGKSKGQIFIEVQANDIV